jgi:hypothetical protein
VEDTAFAEPERDVVRLAGLAEADEVAGASVRLVDLGRGRLLLIGDAGHEPAEAAIRHVHQPRAIDSALGQAAPLVRRAQVRARLGDGNAFPGGRQLSVARPKRLLADPAGIVVSGADAASRRGAPRPSGSPAIA